MVLTLWLCITAAVPVFGQADRQKQLAIKAIIERGNVCMARQLFKEALGEYEKCLDVDPGNITAKSNIVLLHDNWGVYYFKHNQYQDAQMEWETALQLNPNDSKAKANMLVLKNTLAHMGLDLNTESEMIKQEKTAEQEKKNAGEQSAVVILGTNKNKPDTENKNYVDQYYSNERGGTTLSTGSNKIEEKTTSVNQESNPALVDEQLSRIERKVYGHPFDELPVTKRLEKLEMDNFGQVSTLPILQRLQKLNQLYEKN